MGVGFYPGCLERQGGLGGGQREGMEGRGESGVRKRTRRRDSRGKEGRQTEEGRGREGRGRKRQTAEPPVVGEGLCTQTPYGRAVLARCR